MNSDHSDFFTIERRGDASVITFVESQVVENSKVDHFRAALVWTIRRHPSTKFILDFDGVTMCTSAAIGAIVLGKRLAETRGASLCLCGLQPLVREKMQLLNFVGNVFAVFDDVAAALESD